MSTPSTARVLRFCRARPQRCAQPRNIPGSLGYPMGNSCAVVSDESRLGSAKPKAVASPVKVILPLSTCYTRDLLNALSGRGHHAGQTLRAFCRKKPHLCDGARHTGTRTGRRPTECLV